MSFTKELSSQKNIKGSEILGEEINILSWLWKFPLICLMIAAPLTCWICMAINKDENEDGWKEEENEK